MAHANTEDGGEVGPGGPALAGALLRQARERNGLTLDQCASTLRARSGQIEAIERGDLRGFGGDVYARGFLRSYAVLVDVDPEIVLDMHGADPAFRGPVLPPRQPLRLRPEPPAWLIGLVALLVVAGVVATVLGVGGSRVPAAIAPADPALGASEEPGAPLDPVPPPILPEPVPTPAPQAPPVEVVLTFESDSWLEVLVDGMPVGSVGPVGMMVLPGETLRFSGQERIALVLGNAGGVRVEVNGDELGIAGRPGQVLRIGFGPDGPIDDIASASG